MIRPPALMSSCTVLPIIIQARATTLYIALQNRSCPSRHTENNFVMLFTHNQVVAMGFNLEMGKGGIIIASPNRGSNSSTSDSSPEHEEAASRAETKQQKEKEKEVLRDRVSDLPEDEEDYLDLKLNEEAEFLQEYITLPESVSHK